MPLTEYQVRSAQPRISPYKLSDGGGLYILIQPNGHKHWRYKYRFADKEKLLALGSYPDVSLGDARKKHSAARSLKAGGIDPSTDKREKKQRLYINHTNSFESVALEWHEKQKSRWSEYYAKQVMQRLIKDILPRLGSRPIAEISGNEIYKMATVIQNRSALEIAHRAVQVCGQIFQYATLTDRTKYNPAIGLRGALKTHKTKHHPHLSAKELPDFLKAIDAYELGLQTKLALKLILLTFVRSTELRKGDRENLVIPLSLIRYSDGFHEMLTISVIILNREKVDDFMLKTDLSNWSFAAADWQDCKSISTPELSYKERDKINRIILSNPTISAQQLAGGIEFKLAKNDAKSIAKFSDFMTYRKYCPYVFLSRSANLPAAVRQHVDSFL